MTDMPLVLGPRYTEPTFRRIPEAWEYRTVLLDEQTNPPAGEDLDTLGCAGWELTGVLPISLWKISAVLYFKRVQLPVESTG